MDKKYYRYAHGSIDYVYISKHNTAEKAAKFEEGDFVEVKMNNNKVHFNKVTKEEDDGSQKRTPEVAGQSKKKI